MALFKPFRGTRASLDLQELHDGYAYFCTDDGTFHIDFVDAEGNLQRKQINAKDTETLMGMSLEQIKESIATQSDWNINDENTDGYVKNRTHYDDSVVICNWDGDISKVDDIIYVNSTPAMYRIGDCITHTAAEVQALYETVEPKIVTSSTSNYKFQSLDILSADAEGSYGVDMYGFTGRDDDGNGATPVCLNILSDNFTLEALNVVIPKKGMWLIPTSDFTVLRFYFENIKTLDPKFLPNNGQSDWNQNDSTAPDYIKNRTHYTEESVQDVEYKININGEHDIPLALGQTYELWYTTLYNSEWVALTDASTNEIITCEVQTDDDGLYVGDPNHSVWPTCVRTTNSTVMSQFISAYSIVSMKIVTHTTVEVVHRLDSKYLPEDFIVIITQDDEGNYTADKTFEEIFAAYNEGRTVQAKYIFDNAEGTLYYLTYIFTDDQAVFTNNAFAYQENLIIYPDNTIEYVELDLVVSDWFDEEMDNIRSSIVQSNWSQYDSTALDYIQNRPMYFDVESIAENLTASGTASAYTTITPEFIPVDGASYYIKGVHTNDKAVTTAFDGVYECKNGKIDILPWDGSGCPILNITVDGINVGISNSYRVASVVIDVIGAAIYHTLDERYIPNTIARTSDIPEQIQADWNQNDETVSDYIKNRPFYSEVVNNTSELTINEQSSDGGTSTDTIFAKLLYENYTNCVYEVFNGDAWYVGSIDSVETTDTYLVIEISCALDSGNTLGHTVKIAHDYSSINWVRATELSGSQIRFAVTVSDETVHQLDEKFIPNSIARVADITVPTKTSELTNDSGFITNVASDLENYYLKSETYTQDEIKALVSAVPKFSIEVVTSLPTANISVTTVYLLKSGDETDNLYTEYIYVNNAWEYLGKQTVDLTRYALKSEVPAKLSDLTEDTTHRVVTDTEKAAWNAKSDFSGSYNDLADIPTTVRLVDDVTSMVYELKVSNGKLILSEVTE